MPTVVLDAYSKAFPLISNRIKASVFNENDPLTIVASIIDSTAGHPARIYHFPGLPRANYGFSLDEIDGGGIVVNNLALFDVVPGSNDGLLTRDDEQIIVDTTPGFDAGLQVVVFDGTGGKPDYIGWTIVPSELTGRGILALDLDYTWDAITGTFTLLQAGDLLTTGTYYNIHFDPMIGSGGGSVPTITDFSSRIIDVDDNILDTDFGGTIIFEPLGIYLEAQLPDITTIPIGRVLNLETIRSFENNLQCVKIVPNGSDLINFAHGNLFMMNNESCEIYRFKRPDLSNEWRVRNAVGNYLTCGQSVGDEIISSAAFCKQILDGTIRDKFQYARAYNDLVLLLPSPQVCDYDDWATGNNKYLFSYANSTDPGFADQFHFPDRTNLFERNNLSGKAGDFQSDLMKQFWPGGMTLPTILDVTGHNTEIGVDDGAGSPDIKVQHLINTTLFGAETRPKNHLINRYILV